MMTCAFVNLSSHGNYYCRNVATDEVFCEDHSHITYWRDVNHHNILLHNYYRSIYQGHFKKNRKFDNYLNSKYVSKFDLNDCFKI